MRFLFNLSILRYILTEYCNFSKLLYRNIFKMPNCVEGDPSLASPCSLLLCKIPDTYLLYSILEFLPFLMFHAEDTFIKVPPLRAHTICSRWHPIQLSLTVCVSTYNKEPIRVVLIHMLYCRDDIVITYKPEGSPKNKSL